MNTFKIQVTPEQSKELQEKLFALNYCWADGTQSVKLTEHPFLHASNGMLTYSEAKAVDHYKAQAEPELTWDRIGEITETDRALGIPDMHREGMMRALSDIQEVAQNYNCASAFFLVVAPGQVHAKVAVDRDIAASMIRQSAELAKHFPELEEIGNGITELLEKTDVFSTQSTKIEG